MMKSSRIYFEKDPKGIGTNHKPWPLFQWPPHRSPFPCSPICIIISVNSVNSTKSKSIEISNPISFQVKNWFRNASLSEISWMLFETVDTYGSEVSFWTNGKRLSIGVQYPARKGFSFLAQTTQRMTQSALGRTNQNDQQNQFDGRHHRIVASCIEGETNVRNTHFLTLHSVFFT